MDSFTQDSQLRKYIAECDSLINVEEVKKLHTSKPFVEGAEVMKKAEKGGKLSLREFTLVRDYLLCRLTLATGTRPGALTNVLLTDYETSRVSEGNRIILVPKHKDKGRARHAGYGRSDASRHGHLRNNNKACLC